MTAVRSDGTSQDIPVVNNAFSAQITHHAVAVTWTRDGKPDREPINYENDVPTCSPAPLGEHDQAEKAAARQTERSS